ncbi:MAG TPA: amidohydrolase family protein, partial [Kofleriaceae bacterium]|nr:amidohydrolase family protein [Kofleriaceae bacterium]
MRQHGIAWVVAAWVVAGCGSSGSGPKAPAVEPASMVLVGGEITTMDPARPRATAIALAGDRIVAVGDDAEIRALIGPTTRVIELEGRAVSPGLIDAHCHLAGLGTAMENLQVRGATSAEAVAVLVAGAAKDRAPGEWIVGRGWDQNLWSPQAF